MAGYERTIKSLAAATCVVMLLSAAGAAQSGQTTKPPVYKTPQDAFDAIKSAADKGDHKALFGLLSDETRDMFTAVVLMRAAAVRVDPESSGREDKAKKKEIEAVLTKHGITEETARKILKLKNLPEPSENEVKVLYRKIAESLKDPCGFWIDTAPIMAEHPIAMFGMLFKEREPMLKEVTIKGDVATAEIWHAGVSRGFPVAFHRQAGSWRFHLVFERADTKKTSPRP